MDKPDLPTLKNFKSAISPDGKWMALDFIDDQDKTSRIAVTQEQLAGLVTGLIETARKAHGMAPAQAREVVEGAPIEITHLRVGMGRTQSEAVLSISSGPMTLLYSVELSSLLDLGDLIRSKTKRVPPTKN